MKKKTKWAVALHSIMPIPFRKLPRKLRVMYIRAITVADQQDGYEGFVPALILGGQAIFDTENNAKRARNLIEAAGIPVLDEVFPIEIGEDEKESGAE